MLLTIFECVMGSFNDSEYSSLELDMSTSTLNIIPSTNVKTFYS